jgi:predicted amidohydrolase
VRLSGTRVAAVQFSVGTDPTANLATCIRMVEQAATQGARVVVLPAYLNHPEYHPDRASARAAACAPEGTFLLGLAATAARHEIYLKAHVTVHDEDLIRAVDLLFDPSGNVVARGTTRVFTGPERRWLEPGTAPAPVLDTDVGRLGMFSAGDGTTADVARHLALEHAQLLLVSLSSVSTDDTRLHLPVRAAENKVWAVVANTVGARPGAEAHDVPEEWMRGAGESRVIRPDGTAAASGGADEAIVIADIEPRWADNKTRPDGGDLFRARRPRIYAPEVARPAGSTRTPAARATAVVARPKSTGMSAIDEAATLVREAATGGADLVVLPELFFYPQGRADGSFVDGIAVDMLIQALDGTRCHVVTSLPDDAAHVGILIGADGVRGRQLQLHSSARHVSWQGALGDRLVPFDLEWGRLMIVVGDDALYPEVFRLAVLHDTDVVAVPGGFLEPWELALGLPERVAADRLTVVASGQTGGLIAVPVPDPVLHGGRAAGFTGALVAPDVTALAGKTRSVTATVYPERSRMTFEAPWESAAV